ncbi:MULTISPECIES: VOC family protein [Brachybacterium]|uniref:VOC family protein n=1 Tax=Brachybacterium rhamnosum TaxID=173361 RepID=A0ABW4PUA1_9MICO|nr:MULTISPECIES: VOC family protein [Brachybacterium]MCW1804632.1 VOC family protein [Brachybacterium squillarum]QCR54609.1 hypothetical protein C1N80_14180 [Brachybacterium sp. SGAir0954]
MTVQLRAYLNFPGTTREALETYRDIFGGELILSTFGEFHAVPEGHEAAGKIMHAELTTEHFVLNAADAIPDMHPVTIGDNVNLALMGTGEEDLAALTAIFDRLAEGGEVEMPLQKQIWGDVYGAVVDRFAMHWMINVGGVGGDRGDAAGEEQAAPVADPTR